MLPPVQACSRMLKHVAAGNVSACSNMLQPDSKILAGIEILAASSELGTTFPGAAQAYVRQKIHTVNVRNFLEVLSLWATALIQFFSDIADSADNFVALPPAALKIC
jgi:hypothetical protein